MFRTTNTGGFKWTTSSIRRRIACGSLVISLVFTCGVFAQSAEQDADDEDGLLTTVIVTAQKRDQDLQDVPITVTVDRARSCCAIPACVTSRT